MSHSTADVQWPVWPDNDSALLDEASLTPIKDDCSFNDSIYDFLNRYYTIVIIVLGIVGNSISAAVFMRTPLRSRTSSYYLTALALSDTGFLLVVFYEYLISHTALDAMTWNRSKQIYVYASFFFTSLSTWIIICFTVERFIAVQYPLQRTHMCTVRRAKYVIFFTVLLSLVLNVVPLFTTGITDDGHFGVLERYTIIFEVYTLVDTATTLILPALSIVSMNTIIAIRLTKFSRYYHLKQFRLKEMKRSVINSKTRSSITISISNGNSSNVNGDTPNSPDRDSRRPVQCGRRRQSDVLANRNQRNVTKMLLIVSTVFIGLNLPSYATRLYSMWATSTPCVIHQLQSYFMLLFYTNFAINFLLYSTCGVSFRRALFKLSRRRIRSRCAPYAICTGGFASACRSYTI